MKTNICGALSATALVLGTAMLTPGTERAGRHRAEQPLTIGTRVKPNLMLVIDNSGSMDGEGLYPTNDGALWWTHPTRTFWGASTGRGGNAGLNFNDAGTADSTWKKYVYLFPPSRASMPTPTTTLRGAADAGVRLRAQPGLQRPVLRSVGQLCPWPSEGGTTFAAASSHAVKTDPLGITTINVTGNVTQSFRLHPGNAQANGNAMAEQRACRCDDEVGRNYDFTYKVATYFRRRNEASAYTVNARSYNCATPDPAAYAAFFANTRLCLVQRRRGGAGADGYSLTRTQIASGTAEMQNFANWFQYHR
jgi:hypothetical protein